MRISTNVPDAVRLAVVALLAAPAAVPAQDDVDPRLAKAIVVAESEHDTERAARLFEQVAEDPKARAVDRTAAYLRLGRLAARAGKQDLAKTMFEAASRGEGPAAEDARRALSGQDPLADGNVQAKVHQLILAQRSGTSSVVDDLVWLGEIAAPQLVRAVDEEPIDLSFVSRASEALLTIGGPEVGAWLARVRKEYDVLKRRAVVRGVKRGGQWVHASVRDAVLDFLDDPEATVRLEVIGATRNIVDFERIVARMGDPDLEVRQRAWSVAVAEWSSIAGRTHGDDEYVLAHEQLLERVRDLPDGIAERIAVQVLRYTTMNGRLLQSSAGRSVFLRALRLPGVEGSPTWGSMPLGANEHVEEVLATARTLGSAEGKTVAMQLLERFVSRALPSWDRDTVPAALGLLELGYRIDEDWLKERLTDETWPGLFARIDRFRERDVRELCAVVLERGVPAGCFPVLRDWLVQKLATPGAIESTRNIKAFRSVCEVLGAVGTPAATSWLVEYLRGKLWLEPAVRADEQALGYAAYGAVAAGLRRGSEEPSRVAMRDLITAELGDSSVFSAVRNELLARLSELGDEPAIELFPKAYELGLRQTRVRFPVGGGGSGQADRRGWQLAVKSLYPSTGYDATQGARVVDLCLRTRDADAWADVGPGIAHSEYDRAFRLAVARNWQNAPDPARRVQVLDGFFGRSRQPNETKDPEFGAVLLDALGSAQVEARRLAARRLFDHVDISDRSIGALTSRLGDDDAEVIAIAISALRYHDVQAAVPAIRERIGHASDDVRASAIRAVLDLPPEDDDAAAIEAALGDPSFRVRLTGCRLAKDTLDRRWAPKLIGLLKDPHSQVREEAKESLDAIRVYYEEQARWKRLLDEAGLGTENAAEALIKQAREGGSKDIRLAAIRSLGTLAVAETLPFLIQLMQSDDAEIRQAAAAAVDRINR